MKLNYFLPVTGTLVARSKLLRIGTSLVVGEVKLNNEKDELTAAALITYKLVP